MKNMMPRNFKSAANKLQRVQDYLGYQIHQDRQLEHVMARLAAEELIRKAKYQAYNAAQD
jgi:hypothetical protein